MTARRDAGAVERSGLENRSGVRTTGGSNPSPSATNPLPNKGLWSARLQVPGRVRCGSSLTPYPGADQDRSRPQARSAHPTARRWPPSAQRPGDRRIVGPLTRLTSAGRTPSGTTRLHRVRSPQNRQATCRTPPRPPSQALPTTATFTTSPDLSPAVEEGHSISTSDAGRVIRPPRLE